jgi:hypothetical protein
MVGVGVRPSDSEAQVVMQVCGESSSLLRHAPCTTKRRARVKSLSLSLSLRNVDFVFRRVCMLNG